MFIHIALICLALTTIGVCQSWESESFRITVVTSDVENADTTSKIYVTTHGELASCEELYLATSQQTFRRNSIDVFAVRCSQTLGRVMNVTLRIEGSDAWHVDHLVLKDVAMRNAYYLPCHRDCVLDSVGLQKTSVTSTTLYPEFEYELTVYTTAVTNAETGGQVYVTLTGDQATCPEIMINSGTSIGTDSVLKFTATCALNIGRLSSVDVRLTTTDGWNMREMVVRDLFNHHTYQLPCSCWFDNGAGAIGPSSRTLTPGFIYELTVFTSDVFNAQTGENIYVTMVGIEGTCAEFSLNNRQTLSRNSVKSFTTACSGIGSLQSVTLRIGGSDGWNLNQLVIRDVTNERVYYLACMCWLDSGSEAVGPVTQTLLPGFRFEVTVFTSDLLYSDTWGGVYVTLRGEASTCPEFLLNTNRQRITLNSIMTFTHMCPHDVGVLTNMDVRLDTDSDGWRMERIVIEDDWNHYAYEMVCPCWFDDGPGAVGPTKRTSCPELL